MRARMSGGVRGRGRDAPSYSISGNFIGVVDNARRLFQHKTLRPTIFRTR